MDLEGLLDASKGNACQMLLQGNERALMIGRGRTFLRVRTRLTQATDDPLMMMKSLLMTP